MNKKIELTDRQREAVYTHDCDLLVSAAAGSGKTAVLSERVLQSILDQDRRMSITDFLIVTFTNAAASEMKDRIGKKIMQAATEKNLSPEMKKHLRRQLSLMAKANITTIHSFCLEIIKNNFHLVDIDASVRVADKTETEILKFQVAEDVLEEMYSKNGSLFSNLCKWIGGGKDENLISEILDIYRFINGFPKPLEWLNEKVEKFNPEKITDISANEWIVKTKNNCIKDIDCLIYILGKIYEQAVTYGITPYEETFAGDIKTLTNYRKQFDGDIDLVLGVKPVFDTIKAKPRDADANVCADLRTRRNEVKKAVSEISSIFDFTKNEFMSSVAKIYSYLKCLENSIILFDKLYKEKKRKSSIIDFGDFEHLALEILEDGENGVADAYRERFSEIMIDEYQDCNQTQELIFSYINRKKDDKSTNMFMVGDIKQSIYRFRLADPDIFADKSARYTSDGLQKKIVLNRNFRSSATILDAINSIFEKIMRQDFGGTDYKGDERLFYRDDCANKSFEEKCELVIVDKDLSKNDCDNTSADYIAEKIIELASAGRKFSEIAILVRNTKSKLSSLENSLKLRNIPYFADSGGGYFDSIEIGILTSLLKVVDNPMQDIDLVALLRSPIFDFDENLLADIRLKKKGPFYGALIKYAAENGENAEKCNSFLNTLSVWRDKVLFMPVDEFIEYVISDSGIGVFAASLKGGEQRTANLKLFVHQARMLGRGGLNGLFSFVNYMERMSASGESGEAKMLSENSNVVRILTIHKSKGLEFPVVFLYGCETPFNKRDTYSDLILHKNDGIGVKFLDVDERVKYPFISHNLVKNSVLQDGLSEEMRVLYVALTRAKEKLICTADMAGALDWARNKDLKGEEVDYLAHSSNSFLDWIMLGIDDNWQKSIISPDSIKLTVAEKKDCEVTQTAPPDISDISEIFGYKYPYEKSSKLPTKISVSEVKRRQDVENADDVKIFMPEIMSKPNFMTEHKISPAEKGIINHLVLKHIDLKSPDVDSCIDSLISKGLMAENERRFVEKEGINSFFESSIGNQLLSADKVLREMSFATLTQPDKLFGGGASYDNDEMLLQGVVDLIFIKEGRVTVVDYKTDEFLDENRIKMYKTQLDLYAVATEKILGKKVDKKYLYMLKQKRMVEV